MKTSIFPRAISIARAKEILRDRSKMSQARTDILATAWCANPNFSRSECAEQMHTSRQTVTRMIDWLNEENELAAGHAVSTKEDAPKNADGSPGVPGGTGDAQALSGPQLLAMIDQQLREADAQGRNRDFQVLLSARQTIADASAEVAAAYVDPMRLCGKRGLDGMPQRIIDVIEVIRPHMQRRYPLLYQYLCEFGTKADTEPDPSEPS